MARQELPNVVAVLSPSAVEARAMVEQWIERLLGKEADEYSVVKVDAAAAGPDDLQPHVGGMSLLADERVIVVERADEWTASQQRALVQMLRGLPPGVSVILTVVGEQATRRAPLHQDLMDFVERYGAVQRAQKLRPWDAQGWVQKRAKEAGVEIDPAAARLLVGRVGADQDRLASEIEKLAAYAGEGGRVGPEDVAALVPRTAEASVFALVDAIAGGEAEKALGLVRELMPPTGQEQMAAQLIHLLARQFRLVWQAQALMGLGHRLDVLNEVPEEWAGKLPADPNVVATVRGRDWMARKIAGQARSMSQATVVRALREIYMADLTLKGLLDRRLPAEVVIEILVSRLCMIHAQREAR